MFFSFLPLQIPKYWFRTSCTLGMCAFNDPHLQLICFSRCPKKFPCSVHIFKILLFSLSVPILLLCLKKILFDLLNFWFPPSFHLVFLKYLSLLNYILISCISFPVLYSVLCSCNSFKFIYIIFHFYKHSYHSFDLFVYNFVWSFIRGYCSGIGQF